MSSRPVMCSGTCPNPSAASASGCAFSNPAGASRSSREHGPSAALGIGVAECEPGWPPSIVNVIAAVASRVGGRYPRQILNRKYRQIEADLPFFGGPPADRLLALLEAIGVEDVRVSAVDGSTPLG